MIFPKPIEIRIIFVPVLRGLLEFFLMQPALCIHNLKKDYAIVSDNTPWANAPTGRADQVLVKTGAAHRFLVSESLTLPRPGEGAGCLTGHWDMIG